MRNTILIVDDDYSSQVLLRKMIEKYAPGKKFYIAKDGVEAIEILKTEQIDIIFMDIRMPFMNGFETTNIIKDDIHFQNIPVVAITAYASEKDKEKCYKAGCDDYISKPIDKVRLKKILKKYMIMKNDIIY